MSELTRRSTTGNYKLQLQLLKTDLFHRGRAGSASE